MIGVSLPYKRLCKEQNTPFEDLNGFLKKLKDKGVGSIELRSVGADRCPANQVLEVAQMIWDAGMSITVHGHIHSTETAVDDIFKPLAEVLSELSQKELIVTVHPTVYDNVQILKKLSDHIIENDFPVRIALENNRFLPNKERGDCIGLVVDIIDKVNRENIGICFDMGHYYYNCLIDSPDDIKVLPPKEFLSKVIHTHIHALSKERSTHFPFNADNDLPLKEYLEALAHNYFGLYNIELEYQRFADIYDIENAWFESIEAVKAAMPFCGQFYDDIRANFKEKLESSAKIVKEDKEGFSLVHSSSYLFNINGTKWGVDFALRYAGKLSDCYKDLPKLLSDLQFMLITHEHDDHFDPQTADRLKDGTLKWIIPDFMTEKAIGYGIKQENIITAKANIPIEIQGFSILPFEGRHFRKTNGQGVASLGYFVTSKNSPSLLFLGDIRDYTKGNISVDGEVDYLFSHVWLGDNVAGNDTLCGDIPQMFVDYMSSFKPKNIVLAHLYESGRSKNNMWKMCHAKELSKMFERDHPEIKVHIPLTGDTIIF